ncbi:MAG: hypothetical protein ACLP8B_16060 [Xanthobacteraceae bacterium]
MNHNNFQPGIRPASPCIRENHPAKARVAGRAHLGKTGRRVDEYPVSEVREPLQKEIAADTAARGEATKLLIAEQGRWYTAIVRPLFALPFIVFGFKVVVWDKVLGWGVTDRLDPNMWGVFQTIIVSYFGASAVERVARIFRR